MIKQITGKMNQVESLISTVFNNICVLFDEEGQIAVDEEGNKIYSYEAFKLETEEQIVVRWDTDMMTEEADRMLDTILFYRLQDKMLTSGMIYETEEGPVKLQVADNHFRILTTVDKYEKMIEDYFVYNGITPDNYMAVTYPMSLSANMYKVELIAINVSDEKMDIMSRQGKVQKKAQVINQKITKLGDTLSASTKVVMNDVINPLGKTTAKMGATVIGGLGKTAVDMAIVASNELLRDVATLSLSELKNRDEMKTMAYSINKILNKNNKPQAKQSTNNFSL